MTAAPRRGVTRGYVAMLIFAAVTVATALTVATWGLLSLGLDAEPVTTDAVPRWGAPVAIALALVLLAWTLWSQALTLLRGRARPPWGHVLWAAVQPYLLWGLMGLLLGLSAAEGWLSPFALVLVPIWAVVSLLFWAVLTRRVYSDRGRPRWPWERDDDLGPDWANYGLDPWHDADTPAGGDDPPEAGAGDADDERPDGRPGGGER